MSYMFVHNFEGLSHVTLVLEPDNRPASLAQKAISVKNGLSTAKNISHGCSLCLKIPFHPNQPTFGRDEVDFFFLFFFFFFLIFVCSSSSKSQNIEI